MCVEVQTFLKILEDKSLMDYRKMQYKYKEAFSEFLQILEEVCYTRLSLTDAAGAPMVFLEKYPTIRRSTIVRLLQNQSQPYSLSAIEEEIVSTSSIENINFDRLSVRNVLNGKTPCDEQESRILGIKCGLEFIADVDNKITEENLYHLYTLLGAGSLPSGTYYRDAAVYVVSDHIKHMGINHWLLPSRMQKLIFFINREDGIDDLIKAAIIHFYVAYLHPYFDGNGRMARLLHLWFLIQRGYQSTLFLPFSSKIEESKQKYYQAFTAVEANQAISGKLDVTPFLAYFTKYVY